MSIRRIFTTTGAVAAIAACGWTAPLAAQAQQDTLSVAARLVMRQPAGTVLRVNADREQVTGVMDRVAAGMLYLESPPRAVELSSITDAWLQRRSTMRGGKVGALIGAPAGAAVFGFGAWLLSGLCEYDCDADTGDYVAFTLVGAAAGAASGFIVGALIGSSVPRWEPLTEGSAPANIATTNPRLPTGLGAFSVTPVVARGASDAGGSGIGLGVSYLSQVSRHLALGAEAATYDVAIRGPGYYVPCSDDPETLCLTAGAISSGAWTVGGLMRAGAGADRRLEPYALAGIGVTDFGHVRLGGYSVGAGARYRLGTRFAVSGEARWHSNLTNSGDDSELGFYTLGAGLTVLR